MVLKFFLLLCILGVTSGRITFQQYGEKCSKAIETLRLSQVAEVHKLKDIDRPKALKMSREHDLKEIKDGLRHNICDHAKLLVCDEKTEKCVCGLLGAETQAIYTAEMHDDQMECRLKEGAPCVQAGRNEDGVEHAKMTCCRGTLCAQLVAPGVPCAAQGVIDIERDLPEAKLQEEMKKAFMRGEICTCQPTFNNTRKPDEL